MVDLFTKERNFKLFFVESICEEPSIIEANILVSIDIGELIVSLFSCTVIL